MAPSVIPSSLSSASKRPRADGSDAELLESSLPQDEGSATKKQQQKCPRCGSTNTKFCYYNNYSTAQPRHFCRACRRYWTHGGTLRDVPVGGGSRRGSVKRRKASNSPPPPPPPCSAGDTDVLSTPDMMNPVDGLPFGNDSFYLPQFDHGGAPEIVPGVPEFYYGLPPWDGGSQGGAGAAGMTSAWQEIADLVGLDLSWPPPSHN